MLVTEFQLDRFLNGNPLRVLDLGNGLNVALVRSQAGRAQLLNVIPTSFYGPAPFFWDGDEQPSADGISGQLVLRTDHGVFRFHRDLATGDLFIQSPGGTDFSDDHLYELLDGVDVDEYRDLFTFDLHRLKQLIRRREASLPKLVRMAQFLVDASGAAANLPQEVRFSQQEALVDLSAPEGALRALLEMLEHEAHEPDEDEETASPQDRENVTRDLKKIDASLQEASSKIAHLEEEIRETQCAMALNRGKARQGAIDRELAELAGDAVPQEISNVAEESIERLAEKIAACNQQLKQKTMERDELVRQGQALRRDDRMTAVTHAIESVLLYEKSATKESEAIERLKQKINDIESQIHSRRHDEGPDLGFSGDSNAAAARRISELARRLQEAERDQEIAEQRLVHSENASLRFESAAGNSYGVGQPEEEIALHQAELRVAELQEQLAGLDQMELYEHERIELERRVRDLYRGQLLPFQTALLMGLPCMVGGAMIIYGLTQYEVAHWRLVIMGFILSGVTASFKMMYDRERTEALVRARGRLAKLNQELADVDGDGEGVRALHEQLVDAQRELQRRQAQMPDRVPRQHVPEPLPQASIPVEQARAEMERAQRRLRDVKGQWRELLGGLGLPTTLTADAAAAAISDRLLNHSDVSESHALELQLAAARSELDTRVEWMTVLAGKLRQLLRDAAVPSSGTLPDQFVALREAYTEFQERRKTRRQLARSVRKIRQQAKQLQSTGRSYAAQRRQLESDATHSSSQRKIRQRMRSERRKLLEQQRELIEEDMAEVRQRFGVESKTPLAEFSDEELESRLVRLNDKLESVREKCLRQYEKRGRLRAMLSKGDSNGSHVAWERLLEQTRLVRDEIRAATRQVIDVPLNQGNGGSAAQEYLSRASEFLTQLSGNQFQSIMLEEDSALVVVDDQHRIAAVHEIHPNHLPNIYFSLWLARLEAYADRGIRLPILMEDPLEATRDVRRVPVARMLSDFAARGHQVILVTSQPQTAAIFGQLGIPVADFSEREPTEEIIGQPDVADPRPAHYPQPDLRHADEESASATH